MSPASLPLLRATLAAAALLAAGPAWAHAHLQAATPPDGGVVTATPAAVELSFTEPLEARFSELRVSNAVGAVVASGARLVESKRLVLELPSLPEGEYLVTWRVLAVDTHRTEGQLRFTIRKP
jgi:methionine-rich copper-binding protein CopC